MRKLVNWVFPALSIVVFATLLWAMLLEWEPWSTQAFISFASGLLAYSMMLTVVIISVRPKFIEHKMGLPEMYTVHGWMALALAVAIIIHVTNQWSGFANIFSGEMSTVSLAGFIGVVFLIIVMLTGIFVLSNTFIKNSKTLMRLKETYFKRERHLWLHRLSLLSIVAIYLHMYNVGFLASNTVFMSLLTIYTVIVLGLYIVYKVNLMRLPKYQIKSVRKPTPTLYEIDIEPANGSQIMDYEPGQYAFIRFVDSNISNESHPFSFSSAPEFSKDSVQMIIKESGDFTRTLNKVKEGDKVTLEGPYGNYFPEESAQSDKPIVLLSGGIGVTPNLSILRHEISQDSNREIVFVWGLAYKEDMLYIEELEQLEKEFPNFSYHLIFSNEEVEGYPYGFISSDYLDEIGVNDLYKEANFFICGPAPMLNASNSVLVENDVDYNQIHLEEFAF